MGRWLSATDVSDGCETRIALSPFLAMPKVLIRIITAFALTIASAWIDAPTDEYAVYGNMGTSQQNWQLRKVAGWPAPYLADNPGTSIVHEIGLEDDFRPMSFVATLSFWFLVTLVIGAIARRLRARIAGRSK